MCACKCQNGIFRPWLPPWNPLLICHSWSFSNNQTSLILDVRFWHGPTVLIWSFHSVTIFLIQVLHLSCISFASTPNKTHCTNIGSCRYGTVYFNLPVAALMLFYIMLLQSCSESEYLHLECITVCVYICLTYSMILPVSQNMYVECGECVVNNRLQLFLKERFGLCLEVQEQNRSRAGQQNHIRPQSECQFLDWDV